MVNNLTTADSWQRAISSQSQEDQLGWRGSGQSHLLLICTSSLSSAVAGVEQEIKLIDH